MNIVGIDPGLKGGIAAIGCEEERSMPMPIIGKDIDARAVLSFLQECGPGLIVIERVSSMPKQGVSSTFSFGKGFGMLIGIVEAEGYPYRMVTPQAWKKVVLAGTAKDKDAAVQFVHRAYPKIALKPGRCRKAHDGIADAVCLAEWGRLQLL